MAEFFTPSTTGEGQGAAQIFQSNPQFADASGIVRGIERASLSLAKQREQQYEEEKEKVKKEQELKNKISEARKGTGVATIDKAVNKIYEKGIKDAYSLDNDDPIGTIQQAVDDMNNLKDVAYPIFSKGVESSRSEIEKAGGASSFVEGVWKPTVVGRSYQQALDGTLYTEEEINRKIEGGTLLTDLVADFSVYKEDPDFHINSDVTSMASNLKKNLIDVYGAKKENLKNPSVIGGRDVVYKVSDFTPASKIKMKQEAQNNSQLKTAYRNQKMRKENLSLAEFEEKYPPEVFNAMFLEELINPMFEGATAEVISTKKDKEDGKGITEQDLTIAKQVKEAVNILQDNPSSKESKEGLNTFLAPYNVIVKSYGDSTPIEIKDLGLSDGDIIFVDNDGKAKSAPLKANDADGIYRVIAKAAPDVKLEALGQIELKDPTPQGDVPEISAEEKTQLDSAFKELNKGGLTKAPKYLDDLGVKLEGNWSDGYVLVIGDKKYRADDKEQAKQAYIEAQKLVGNKTTTAPPKEVETDFSQYEVVE